MKTKIVFCFFVVVIFFAGQASAKIADVTQKDVKALTSFANEKSWQSLIDLAMKKGSYINCPSGKPSGKCVTFDFLTNGMYAHATKHPDIMELVNPENRTKDAYIKLTRKQNSMPETGGTIPVEDLKELVFSPDERGIYYAREDDRGPKMQVAQAPLPVRTDASPAISTVQPAVKTAEVAKPSETEAQISDLQNQIANLKKTLAGNTKAIGRLATLEKKLNELVGSVGVLGKDQTTLAQNQAKISASMDEITSSLTEIRNQYQEELIAVKNEISGTKSEIYADIEAMAKAIELNQMIVVVSLLGTIVSVFVIILQLRRRDNKKIDNLRVDLNSTSDMVAEMRVEDLNSKECTDGLSLQKVSRSKIDSMEIGEEIEVVYEIPGKIMTIKVCRISKKTLRLFNVKRRANDQKDYTDISFNSNVAETITRAIVDDRVVGGSVTVSQVVA